MGSEMIIPISDINYIQVGSELIENANGHSDGSRRSISADPKSVYISAGESSVRIRFADQDTVSMFTSKLRASRFFIPCDNT